MNNTRIPARSFFAMISTLALLSHAAWAKSPAEISLSGLNPIYDASPKAVEALTNPPELTVHLTYNDLSTAPTSAGSYEVVASIDDADYEGTVSGTLVISKAAATVVLGDLTATYNGSTMAASASTDPVGLTVTLTYDGLATAPTDAG